jgi:hypothetical protein
MIFTNVPLSYLSEQIATREDLVPIYVTPGHSRISLAQSLKEEGHTHDEISKITDDYEKMIDRFIILMDERPLCANA